MSIWDDYKCDGQMSLNDWLSDRDKVREVGIIGLCDDPICSMILNLAQKIRRACLMILTLRNLV